MRPLAATTRPTKKMFLVFIRFSLAALAPACPSSNSYCSCARLIAGTWLMREPTDATGKVVAGGRRLTLDDRGGNGSLIVLDLSLGWRDRKKLKNARAIPWGSWPRGYATLRGRLIRTPRIGTTRSEPTCSSLLIAQSEANPIPKPSFNCGSDAFGGVELHSQIQVLYLDATLLERHFDHAARP